MILAAAAVLAFVQDTHDLQWKADAERRFTCVWNLSQQAANPTEPAKNLELTQEHTASAKLVKTERGIELQYQLTRFKASGNVQGRALEVLYENGELKKVPEGPEFTGFKQQIEKPGTLLVSPTGRHHLVADQFMARFFKTPWFPLGAQLPAKTVKAGTEWEGIMEPETPTKSSIPVAFKFERVEGSIAKIRMRHSKVQHVHGPTLDEQVENDSDFDLAGGYTARSVTKIHTKATREGEILLAADIVMEFQMTPEKKK